MNPTHELEVQRGERFAFGANWSRFLAVLNDERIGAAERSMQTLLGVETLKGSTFLDIGSGSGLFSLTARRLGARVTSFDYDPDSVGCTRELRRRFDQAPDDWTIEEGSVLNREYLESLGQFDVVYSWGVLHHTGDMWQAIANASERVRPGGRFALAIYNDQGLRSRIWLAIKKLYCSGFLGRVLVLATFVPALALRALLTDLTRLKNPIARYSRVRIHRGMSPLHDWVDWLGGLPFEVASADAIFRFLHERGFQLVNLKTVGGRLGNNEFVFERTR